MLSLGRKAVCFSAIKNTILPEDIKNTKNTILPDLII
jgi:hypothetical protein